MRILLINLDRHSERRDWMNKALAKRHIAYERVQAVDANSLSDELMDAVKKSHSHRRKFSSGDLACHLSHKKCWEIIAQGEDEYGCILEDDLHLSEDAAYFLSSNEWIPAHADVIKIETFAKTAICGLKGTVPVHDHRLRRLIGHHFGTGGYIVSRNAAKRLLELYENCYDGMSFILFSHKYGSLTRFRVLQLEPAICIQDMRLPESKRNSLLSSTIKHDNLVRETTLRKWGRTFGLVRRRSGFLMRLKFNVPSQIFRVWIVLRHLGVARRIPFKA